MNPTTLARRVLGGLAALVMLVVLLPAAGPPAQAQAFGTVRINEFLALNSSGVVDNTGQLEDWIELYNSGSSGADLSGWSLQAGGDTWTFPAGWTIGSNEYKVLFASGDETRTSGALTHLPFKLASSGELLILRNAAGAVIEPSWPAPGYPPQAADDSYGIASGGQLRYFTNPTPGSANGSGVGGRVEPVTFSVPHGYYTSSRQVVLNTSTPSSTIRYTTDGSTPTETNGTAISPGGTVTVGSTTVLRAVAYRSGWITSATETRSYLFAGDIVNQTAATPPGWPADGAVNGQAMDYEVDGEDVPGGDSAAAASLTAIPTISITTDLENLFDPATGIYVNASRRGSEWERPASIELIDPTGNEAGFDINGGIRMRGGFSRNASNPKHSFRLFFRTDYDDGRLEYPLFGLEGAEEFAKVDLRTSQNYAWSWRRTANANFIEELWSRDTQAAMGQPYTRTRPYHLILNGRYWGLYQSQERVSGEYGEAYLGGDENDFDVVKRNGGTRESEATEGTYDAWASLWPLVNDLTVTNAEYATLESQVNLANLADYYLVHTFSGDFDGSPSWFFRSPDGSVRWASSNNWYAARNRNGVGLAGKWVFFDHDSEHSLCGTSGPTGDHTVDNTVDQWNLGNGGYASVEYFAPAWLHQALLTHPGYQQIFKDRVQVHMIDSGGALNLATATARLNSRADQVRPAVNAESARWGDAAGAALGLADWENGVQRLRDCLASRYPVVEQQLRNDGLWPTTSAAPTISPTGGAVSFGTDVTLSGSGGTIWVTTDGTDPRGVTGSPSASAFAYSGPLSIVEATTINARIDLGGGQWSTLTQASYVLSSPPGPLPIVLNEFNAVSAGNYLGGGGAADVANGTDDTLGRVLGNGGDWFELVVIEEGLDLRGWTVEIWDSSNGVAELSGQLTFAQSALLSELRGGTLITVSESIADDVGYDPVGGDWHINLQSNDAGSGAHFTAASQSNFAVNANLTQIAVRDASGSIVALRTGEGTVPGVSLGSDEVFKLEATPTSSTAHDSTDYNDGTSSTWGLPNRFSAGAQVQNLSTLRIVFGDADCSNTLNLLDARVIAQFAIGARSESPVCPLPQPGTQIFGPASDVDGTGTISLIDARLVAQCSIGAANVLCP